MSKSAALCRIIVYVRCFKNFINFEKKLIELEYCVLLHRFKCRAS